MILSRLLKEIFNNESQAGNALIAGIAVLTVLSIFGIVMSGRMIIDSKGTSKRVVTTKAFYLADGGIQLGRRYLWNGPATPAETTLGPYSIGDGTITVDITHERIDYGGYLDVFRIISTATVGPATRSIVEMRVRGGGNNKNFLLWRERVADEEE